MVPLPEVSLTPFIFNAVYKYIIAGWAPQEFRSSRDQRAAKFQQRAEDLMDEEDLGEFGIGARRIRTAEKFAAGKSAEKRMAWEHDVTTTGTSIAQHLESVIRPVSDSIGKRMLRAMGWREGRGVGLSTAKTKKQVSEFDAAQIKAAASGGFDTGVDDILMTRLRSVETIHGLGYEALSASSVLDERYGRTAAALKAHAKSKGIRGQAFGVGAFEEEDENIYSNYDLDQFDFALDAPGTSEEEASGVDARFVLSEQRLKPRKFYPPPKLPPNYRPAHRPKPLEPVKLPTALQDAMKTLTAIQRAKLLGEDRVSVMELVSDKDRKRLERHRSRWDQRERFDDRGADDSRSKDRIEYPNEPMKQARFKEFLKYLRRGLVLPQPKELSVWEWESERKEFEKKLTAEERGMLPEVRARAQPLAKSSLALPIQELLQNKFTKETGSSGHSSKNDSDKMAAVKMGMFGERTRTTFQWSVSVTFKLVGSRGWRTCF
ncbi:g-patch domain protein [Oesophagostomum dentatum]|uniref:G-patch domain protein n=1 Tax=Oesophagostomum dentatum TaxID=61180 RepID=A0A0B1TCQ2_OESDE|nr:g-patch domain protein [Oesophagostomum dentatum]